MANKGREKLKKHPDPEKNTKQNPKDVPMRAPENNPARDPHGKPSKESIRKRQAVVNVGFFPLFS